MTPRGSTITGQCASLTIRRDTLPSSTPRTGPVSARPADQQVDLLREVDEDLGWVANHRVGLDVHVVAQLRHRAPQLYRSRAGGQQILMDPPTE